MQMGIERESPGTVRIVIYNLGAGIESYHAQLNEGRDTFYQPFLEITNVDEKKLLDKEFCQALLEIRYVVNHPATHEKNIYGARISMACSLKA